MARQLEVWESISARYPGMLENLLCRVALVRVNMQHVGQQVLQHKHLQSALPWLHRAIKNQTEGL